MNLILLDKQLIQNLHNLQNSHNIVALFDLSMFQISVH